MDYYGTIYINQLSIEKNRIFKNFAVVLRYKILKDPLKLKKKFIQFVGDMLLKTTEPMVPMQKSVLKNMHRVLRY